MIVRLLVTISGTRDGVEWPARGAVVELPDSEAADMVRAGLAAATEEVVETAAVAPPETATTPAVRRRRTAG